MLLGLQRRQLRGKIFGTLGLTNSIRALIFQLLSGQQNCIVCSAFCDKMSFSLGVGKELRVKPRRAPAFGPARHWCFAGGA
jgi:hypothetical protein